MNKHFLKRPDKGFTLIELLIVVAIIAILAAIAVPNFLEAQTRSKVARTLADMRTLRTGLESYRVDNTTYPETDVGISANNLGAPGAVNADAGPNKYRSIFRLTSPVSYLTSFPTSPWKETYGVGSGDEKIAGEFTTYLYVRAKVSSNTNEPAAPGTFSDFNNDYIFDRQAYLYGGAIGNFLGAGEWLMKSSGPDAIDNRDGSQLQAPQTSSGQARIYDSSNGTVSLGDIVLFSDTNEPSQRAAP